MGDWTLALRFAGRELRGGLKGFRIFLACLLLGVAVIAAVGSTAAAVRAGIAADARKILGGDVELRLLYRPADAAELTHLRSNATVSASREMRAMARPAAGDERALIELKAVDGAYPLYGAVELEPAQSLAEALVQRNGRWGAVADGNLLARLGLAVGDEIRVGDGRYEVRGRILREPDRGTGVFILGPRLMVADASLGETGLVQQGSLIYHVYRLRLAVATDAKEWIEALKARLPKTVWRIRSLDDAAAGVRDFVDRTGLFLMLVGLAALLVGGVGVGNAVTSYLQSKTANIAILKCLGAPSGFVFRVYLCLIMGLAAVGVAAGLVVGALAPVAIGGLLAGYITVDIGIGPYAAPLLLAAAFGLLTTLGFSLWPLFRARRVPAANLLRDLVGGTRRAPTTAEMVAIGAVAVTLAGLVIAGADDHQLAAGFVAGALLSLALFRGAAYGVMGLARRLNRAGAGRRPALRLALANLYRPGAPTGSVILSLGLGLTVLVAVALVEGNLSREIRATMPAAAPSFFFIDIQRDQVAGFDTLVGGYPGVDDLQRVPMLRGRITAMNGVAADQLNPPADMAWVLEGDRGITWASAIPPGSRIVAGSWWPADYRGPPLVSLDAEVAESFGLRLGDTITVSVLGREFTGAIASFRDFEWTTLTINFVMVFSPGILDGAPQTHIATVRIDEDREIALQRAVADRFPSISSIRVKEALEAVAEIMATVGQAVRLSAGVTLLAGLLVLGGAVIASHHRRVYDAVVMKVLGATRADISRAYLLEYGLLGLVTAVVAAGLGTLTGYLFLTYGMHGDWRFLPDRVAATVLIGIVITLVFGLVGTLRALGQPAAALLRNE